MKLTTNYHTHTYRCGHARGTEEEYVLKAIESGYKILGFADHIFLPGIYQYGTRGNYSNLDDYINTVNNLKEKYKDQIEIHLGFEAEYLPSKLDYYKSLKDKGIEYLILGQHFAEFSENDLFYYFTMPYNQEIIQRYVDDLIKGMETGLFIYVAHPDLFYVTRTKMDDFLINESYRICKKAKELNIPLELNLNGLEWNNGDRFVYSNENFWKIAGEVGNTVIIGVDAHYPEFFSKAKYDVLFNMVKKFNLNLIDHLDL